MKKLLTFVLLLTCFACKKTPTEDMLEPDSFKISILPIKTEGFNEYKVNGTLAVRNTNGNVEYGLVFSKNLNPTIEIATKTSLGTSKSSVDFIHKLNLLDTGVIYYVRAYGIRNKKIEYSANQTIQKLSPQIYITDKLNRGKVLTIFTNIPRVNSDIKVLLNNIPLKIIDLGGSNYNTINVEIPSELLSGEYTLTVNVNNIDVVYKVKLMLLDGKWDKVGELPFDNGGVIGGMESFIIGDWLYVCRATGTTVSTQVQFLKFNYKTNEKITLTPRDPVYMSLNTAKSQDGNLIHFIGGDRIGGYQNSFSTKTHYTYNTITDRWAQESDFPGAERKNAISLIANQKMYVGLGYSSGVTLVSGNSYYTDLWAYDLQLKTWEKMANFPQAKGRMINASFIIGTKIFITCGVAGITGSPATPTKETWCYDTAIDQWSQKADYPGKGEIWFANFTIGNFGYVGMGETTTYDSYYGKNIDNRFYKYDLSVNKWTEVSNIGTNGLSIPLSGANTTNGFVGGGSSSSGNFSKALYIYTP